MGCGSSSPAEPAPPNGSNSAPSSASPSSASPPVTRESKVIQDALEDAKAEDEGVIKMLLLGAGESGKSTIFKQMRLLYGSPRSDEDLRMYGVVVRSNIIVAIRKLLSHLRDLGLEEELDRESKEKAGSRMTYRQAYDELIAHLVDNTASPSQDEQSLYHGDWVGHSARAGAAANSDAVLFMRHHDCIRILWESETMKIVWGKRSAINIIDAHKEYLNEIKRIAAKDYKPTTQDVLIARVRTTQVIMEKYRIEDSDFEIIDVGGQRSERRKWIDCFDNVTAVIFVAALSEYDQTLVEAKRTNRMVETLELFRSVCNNRAFEDTNILLFLNKKDIFAEKIMYSDIAAQRPFHDYSGPPKDYEQGKNYFIRKFKDCLLDDEFSDSFIHTTCATDTKNIKFVLETTRTILMSLNLKKSGFLGTD